MAARAVHDHDSAEGLVPLETARETVLSQIHPLPPIELPLTDAYGCVAATDIKAAVDLPEFASSGMDGYAVRAADVASATPGSPAELTVVGRAMIGHRPEATVGMGEAVQIATGAPIPSGADAVVPIENAELPDERSRPAVRGGRRGAGTSGPRARTCRRARCWSRRASGSAPPSSACSRTPGSRIRSCIRDPA